MKKLNYKAWWPYLAIAFFAAYLAYRQMRTENTIIGSDTIFHFNRFYETEEQIRNGNFSWFMTLYGFNQSGRAINALYGPAFAYLNGLLLLLVGTWYRYQIITSFLVYAAGGVGMYKAAAKSLSLLKGDENYRDRRFGLPCYNLFKDKGDIIMKYNKLITSLAAATLAVSGVSATVMRPNTDTVMAAHKKKSRSRTHYQTRKITRTIKMYQPKGMKKVVQKAYIKRKVTTRKHKKSTYGKWSTSHWKKYKVAKVAGYTASRSTVGAAKVTRKTKNQTIKITYKKIKHVKKHVKKYVKKAAPKKHVKKYVKKAAPKKTVRRSAPASANLTFYTSSGKRTSFWPAKQGFEKMPKKGDKVEVLGQGIINGQLMYQIAQNSDVYVPAKDVKVDYFKNVHFVDYYLSHGTPTQIKAKYDADLAYFENSYPGDGFTDWFEAHPLENMRMWSKKIKVSKNTYEKHNLTYAQNAAQDGRMSVGCTKESYIAYMNGEKEYRQYEAKWAAKHPNITKYMEELFKNDSRYKKYNLNTFEWHFNDNFYVNIRK